MSNITKKTIMNFIKDNFDDVYHKVQMAYSGRDRIIYIDDDKINEIKDKIAIEFGVIPFEIKEQFN